MSHIIIYENEQKFLIELFNQTRGDLSRQVSMFTVGEALGMDRTLSKKMAESLMGWELVEIRTLSGSIAITAQGAEEARKSGAVSESSGNALPGLGKSEIIGEPERKGIEQIVIGLKSQVGNMRLNFDLLTELAADLKSIDAQMTSPKPKTALIRECFRSVRGILEKSDSKEMLNQVRGMLGE
jgi:hypothetical protein